MIPFAVRMLALMLMSVSAGTCACAHDPSTYGGLFRSRNFGATWLNADVGQFVNAALTVAVDPRDSNRLLMGTDTGLLSSENGGRSWTPEVQGLVFGAVFAIAFSPDGDSAICAAPSGVFRFHDGQWSPASVPGGAAPARGIAFGTAPGRVYLLGDHALFVSDDGGRIFRRSSTGAADEAPMRVLAVATRPRELLFAVVDDRLMVSDDGGVQWRQRAIGSLEAAIDTAALDPSVPDRLWVASADRILVSDDLGVKWRAVGMRLPEPATSVRGIAADAAASRLVVATHRGLYRSEDGGASWALKEGNLPVHLEAGALMRDPNEPQTLYATYSLMPYPEVWRAAVQGGNLLSRVDPLSLAGGLAFMVLLLLGGGLLIIRLERGRTVGPVSRESSS